MRITINGHSSRHHQRTFILGSSRTEWLWTDDTYSMVRRHSIQVHHHSTNNPCPWMGSAEHDHHHQSGRAPFLTQQQQPPEDVISCGCVYYYLSKEAALGLWICIKRKRVDTFERTGLTFFDQPQSPSSPLEVIRGAQVLCHTGKKYNRPTTLPLTVNVACPVDSILGQRSSPDRMSNCCVVEWGNVVSLAILEAIKIRNYDGITVILIVSVTRTRLFIH